MKKIVGFYIAFIILLFLSHFKFLQHIDDYQISFLDIGQGDGVYIRTPNNCRILIDAGKPNELGDSLINILPFNTKVIDLAIITHPDLDHYGGFTTISKKYSFQNILISPFSKNTASYTNLIQDLSDQGSVIQTIDGFSTSSYCGLKFYFQAFKEENANDSSIVTKVEFPNGVKLLTSGDISVEQEHKLIQMQFPLSTNIFKANHHGSNSSNDLDFITKIKPDYIVIQSGSSNSFGHPHSRVLRNAHAVGSQILRNDLQGQIDFFFSEGKSSLEQTLELKLEK